MHKSLEEYINNEQEIPFKYGHNDLAHICLAYMSLNDPDPDLPVYRQKNQRYRRIDQASYDQSHRIWFATRYRILDKYVFLDYALKNWGHHMRKQSCTDTEEPALSLFRDKTSLCTGAIHRVSTGFIWLPLEEATMIFT